jgi:hypothetical protein
LIALLLTVRVAISKKAPSSDGRYLAKEAAQEYVKFANDRLFASRGDGDIRVDTCNMGSARDGIEYVQDMIPLQGVSTQFAGL